MQQSIPRRMPFFPTRIDKTKNLMLDLLTARKNFSCFQKVKKWQFFGRTRKGKMVRKESDRKLNQVEKNDSQIKKGFFKFLGEVQLIF